MKNPVANCLYAALLLAPLPAFAADPAVAPGAGEDRVVCRYMMRTGTRFKSKTCRTVAQWEKMTEENRKAASELIDRPAISIERGN